MQRDKKQNKKDEHAAVGIGTMIVFIATVLVAAVAAGVLIDMSGKLQERSSRTGTEATEQVASNFEVESVVGKRDSSTTPYLDDLEVTISLAPGAGEVDLGQLQIRLQNGTSVQVFNYSQSGSPGATTFIASELRDADGSWSVSTPVMSSGDLIRLDFALDTASMEYPERDEIQITLIPEAGTEIVSGFSTPASYGVKTVIRLV